MFKIVAKDKVWKFETPQIMAIMNVNMDSFYEISRINEVDTAVKKAEKFIIEGATIIDIGGQSTRPGAILQSPKTEINNIIPIIEAIHDKFPDILLSVDTFNNLVAQEALKAGAHIINDISCGQFDKELLATVAKFQAGYIGMHVNGTFETMHVIQPRFNLMDDLIAYFTTKKKLLSEKGIHHWIIDPGFGFGKSIEENFNIVKSLKKLLPIQLPILLGVSRKSTIYKTLKVPVEDALNGTTVLHTIGLINGASILRVHDVKEAKQISTLIPFLT